MLERPLNRAGCVLALAALLLGALAPRPAAAATIRWAGKTFSYQAQGKPLREFLSEFASNQGLVAVVAPEVSGTVNGRFNLTPSSMLDLLTTQFGLVWFYDGNVLYISPASDTTSRVLPLGNGSTQRLRDTLQRLDLVDPRFPVVYDVRANTALVSGPKRYVELVVQAARAAEDSHGGSAQGAEIRVFPLKYAWAADFSFTQGGREVVVPGVATVLANLYAPAARARNGAALKTRTPLRRLQSLGVVSADPQGREQPVVEPADFSTAPRPNELPQFQSDGRMNAVVVRDLPERMGFYEGVIRALDTKPGLVEIEVRIIEVRSSDLENLGVDWRAQGSRFDAQLGQGSGAPLTYGGALNNPAQATAPLGGSLTAIAGNAGKFLIARVNALAQDGKANILSSPRVMTLDNVEAVMENISTFFVRVAGNLDVALFDVSAGTSMRVTPLIVSEGDKRQIKLAVRIEDGSLGEERVDAIPVVQRSTIGTQAFVNEGDSLLLGGYLSESSRNSQSGVPGLSKLPMVGGLFRTNSKSTQRTERLFMITPRIVNLP